jgi:hypothetical protein
MDETDGVAHATACLIAKISGLLYRVTRAIMNAESQLHQIVYSNAGVA